jgi:glutathione synthase
MRLLFIMDGPERIDIDRDTTFVFMLEAQRRGWEVFHTRREWLWYEDGRAHGRFHEAKVARKPHPDHLVLGEAIEGPLEEHDAVFVRTDPPFDLEYVKLTWLLDAVDRSRTLVVNEPAGIRGASEKLYTLRFPDLTPRQVVTRDIARLEAFLEALGGKMVVKPIDWMGGYGVFVVRKDDSNRRAILEVSTRDGKDLVVAQAYLPEAREGDKRIILLDGQPLGATLRVPAEGEHRGNIHVGATTVKTTLTDADLRICEALAPALKRDGLYFVGIDVIGGRLTEVNVTSPTGVQEIDRLDGACLEASVMDFVAARVPARAGA